MQGILVRFAAQIAPMLTGPPGKCPAHGVASPPLQGLKDRLQACVRPAQQNAGSVCISTVCWVRSLNMVPK